MSVSHIKANFDILTIAENPCGGLTKTGANCYQAKINPLRSEKTSSLYFYADTQSFYDFGSGSGGDIVDFMALLENTTVSEIVKKYSPNTSTPFYALHSKDAKCGKCVDSKQNESHTPRTLDMATLNAEFEAFEPLTFSNPLHKKELLEISPLWLYKEAKEADLALFKDLARYDAKNQTTAAKWCKTTPLTAIDSYEMVSYKRRRFMNGKWVNRKDTKPNATPFCRIYDDNAPIVVVEGAHDMLTGILLGLNIIAIPSSGFKAYDAINAHIKPNARLIYLVEDMAAFKAMDALAQNINATNGTLLTFVTNENDKIDLSDYLITKNTINEVIDGVFGLNKQGTY